MKLRFLLLLLVPAFMACDQVIDWKVDSDQIKLVVEGRVTNEFKQHQMLLTQTADYFNASGPAGVEGATVEVSDGENTYIYQETTPGLYVSQNPFAGVVGRTYSLSIQLMAPLGGSASFEASSMLLPPFVLDSLYNVKEPIFAENGDQEEDSVYVIGIYGQETIGVDNSYLFEVYSNEILETDSIGNLGWFDDDFLENEYLEDFLIYEMDEGVESDSITVLMYSLEDEYLVFIESIITESDGAEPLGLSGPPANVVGNLTNGGLGYFYAASVDTVSTILE